MARRVTADDTVDPQMQSQPMGLISPGSTPPAESGGTAGQDEDSGSTTAAIYSVFCLSCNQEGKTRRRITASLRCQCGSDDLVFEAAEDTTVPEALLTEGKYTAWVAPVDRLDVPTPDHTYGYYWHVVDHGPGTIFHGWMPDEDGAKISAQAALDYLKTKAPVSASRRTAGDAPPWAKDDDDKKKDDDKSGDDKGDDSSDAPPASGDDAPPVAPGAPAPGAPVTPAVPGVPGTTPTGPPGTPNAATPAAPTAAATPQGQIMDAAQQILDQAVDALAQLGHDAHEIKYDVDALTSEWRCNGCEAEGQAQIATDGQPPTLQGDLFEAQEPCPSPAVPDQQQPVPQEPLPQGQPAANNQIPPDQTQIPIGAQGAVSGQGHCPHCGSNSEYAPSTHVIKCRDCGNERPRKLRGMGPKKTGTGIGLNDYYSSPSSNAEEEDLGNDDETLDKSGAADDPNTQADQSNDAAVTENVSDDIDMNGQSDLPPPTGSRKETYDEKVSVIAERILQSNPGMNDRVAIAIAKDTLGAYPSLQKGVK